MLLVTSDRGLAGAFNGQIIRAGVRARTDLEREGKQVSSRPPGRRGVGTLNFASATRSAPTPGFTDRPAYANAREIASDLIAAYVDGEGRRGRRSSTTTTSRRSRSR
jgi:F-type H+-transporting ATPase subunit gamma